MTSTVEYEASLREAKRELAAAASADDVRTAWRKHFGTLGHRALGTRFGVMEGQLRDGVAVDGVALDAALSDLRALVDQHAAQLPPTAQDS